ncbi:MAG: HAMP domain-containing histidine kinase [Bacteroidales bacterium]|jgi:signal transduction histidine kinase|nr:HAMP domain-containing histidine kinase [Bacteroidales bacterium]
MKLIHYTTGKLTLLLFLLISTWGILFFFAMHHEIMDETDDMLRSYRDIFIKKALKDSTLLNTTYETTFDRYAIHPVNNEEARHYKEKWLNEDMYFPEGNEHIPVRVYKSIFLASDGCYYELEVKMSTLERDDMIETLIIYLTALFILLLVCIYVGNLIILKNSFSPLKKLLLWLNSIIPGKPVPPLNNDTKIIEFKQLNDAAYNMSQLNFKVYEQQKQFTENAAHELQTPLATALNKLDQYVQNEQLTEKQLTEIDLIYRSLNNVIRLNKSLLLISRIENKQFHENINININSSVYKMTADFTEIYEYKNLELIIESKDECNVLMNEILSEILISNLLKNAFIHSENNGKITVIIEKSNLIIKNTGENALDEEKIFDRFYMSSNKKENSTGLGLSIIRSICNLYKFHIYYQFRQEHIFTIKFK